MFLRQLSEYPFVAFTSTDSSIILDILPVTSSGTLHVFLTSPGASKLTVALSPDVKVW